MVHVDVMVMAMANMEPMLAQLPMEVMVESLI